MASTWRCLGYFQAIKDSLAQPSSDQQHNSYKVLSFIGLIRFPRDMIKCYLDAMTLEQCFGELDFLITIRCNPLWQELIENLLPCELPQSRPDLLCRVFKAELES